jgi:hypothetical protein
MVDSPFDESTEQRFAGRHGSLAHDGALILSLFDH